MEWRKHEEWLGEQGGEGSESILGWVSDFDHAHGKYVGQTQDKECGGHIEVQKFKEDNIMGK